jgi:hypothetical protein
MERLPSEAVALVDPRARLQRVLADRYTVEPKLCARGVAMVHLVLVILLAGCGEGYRVAAPGDHNTPDDYNLPPRLETPPLQVDHNDPYSATIVASDPDGDSVTVWAVELPKWLTFDSASRVLAGFPGEENIGGHQVVLRASDGRLSTTLTFVLTVVLAPCLERAIFGDPALSDYVLPFLPGTTVEVLQSYCGPGSHARDNQLAYDFRSTFGEPVAAARGGWVSRVVDYWADTDKDDSHFNYLVITHIDGSFAFYAHLKQKSFLVSVGEEVSQGQVIAASGESGTPTLCAAFGECAVLHFGVYRRTWALDIPVDFRNAAGPLDARGGLVRGAFYTALP